MTPSNPWRRLTGSVRLRATAAATVIVAVALSIGAAVVLTRFRASLDNNRRNAAITRAVEIASLASSGRLPAVLGLPSEAATFAQVVDRGGRVVAASANITGEGPITRGWPFSSGPVVEKMPQSPTDSAGSGSSRLVGLRTSGLTVYTGYSLVGSDFAVRDVQLGLFIGLPLVLMVVAATSWLMVGRALRPIDAIRAEVAEIAAQDLHRRVPEPPSADEVARLARTMNSMLERLEYQVERQKAFVADASHELRSPLASLRTQLEVGLAGGAGTDWEQTALGALAEEARIESMVRDLLLLARLEPPPAPGQIAPVDLGAIVTQELGSRPPTAGVSLTAEIGEEGVDVRLPPDLARRLVANLVDNAQRHAQSQVTVRVTREAPGTSVLSVEDDGPGVAPPDRERVFERFTRLDVARSTDDGGAGLGLAIVREIATRHGGSVGFTDSEAGAKVVVRLPHA